MNTSAGLLFVALGIVTLWAVITGRLQGMLDALTGAVHAPASVSSVAPQASNLPVGYGVVAPTSGAPGTLEGIPGYTYDGSATYVPLQPLQPYGTRGTN